MEEVTPKCNGRPDVMNSMEKIIVHAALRIDSYWFDVVY